MTNIELCKQEPAELTMTMLAQTGGEETTLLVFFPQTEPEISTFVSEICTQTEQWSFVSETCTQTEQLGHGQSE